MFTEKDIKPIPQYIKNLIYKKDKKSIIFGSGYTRFYSYLTKYKSELAQVYVAVKNKGKNWYCKQVAIHLIHNKNKCFVKDIACFMISGYVVGWYEQGLSKYQKWFEGAWDTALDKHFNMYAPVVNQNYALKIKEYKYSAVDRYKDTNILKYLRLYEEYPIAEMLIKLGLSNYATSKMILSKLSQDKKFRKWIIINHQQINNNCYYVSTLLLAYKNKKSLKDTQRIEADKKYFIKSCYYKDLKKFISLNEIKKFKTYITTTNIGISSYIDYLDACDYLKLDMTLAKNKYPKDFKKWHDIRIDEYHSAKIKNEKQEKKEFKKKFLTISNKYSTLQRILNDDYAVIIAKSPAELINEGKQLNHCVGRMNYDQKFVREETLIFFIRNQEDLSKPFVTIEYSLSEHKVLQCYGKHDKRPANEILEFVNKYFILLLYKMMI